MRYVLVTLGMCLLLGGCEPKEPPEPPVAPMMEDLSQWTVPELEQPLKREPVPTSRWEAARKPTAAEKLYDYAPGQVYQIPVGLDAPVDLALQAGEQVHALIGSDPKPLVQSEEVQPDGTRRAALKSRWEYKEAVSGVGEQAQRRVFLRALEGAATLGLNIYTTRRVYYLVCTSVAKSPIRAVRWTYPAEPVDVAVHEDRLPALLPGPEESRLYHVGYEWQTSQPVPQWTPRQVVDDGKKLYILYPEVTLFGTVPLVRALGVNGPQVLNVRQFLTVAILDVLAPKIELRVGTGEHAELVTVRRGPLRTITCPGDEACPRWPAAAQRAGGRNS